MKPYTLKWWLSRLVSAEINANKLATPDTIDQYREAIRFADWIRERIITKYGEK